MHRGEKKWTSCVKIEVSSVMLAQVHAASMGSVAAPVDYSGRVLLLLV